MSDPMLALRQRFLTRTTADLTRLRTAGPGEADEVLALVHRLAGAAGVFGFHEVSRLASLAEDHLRAGGPVDLAPLISALEALPAATAS